MKDIVRKLIEEGKKGLLAKCKRFHEMESRDISYVVSRNIISEEPCNTDHILAGVWSFLVSWNWQFLRPRPQIRKQLPSDILDAYNDCRISLTKLQGKRLESVNLNNPEIVEIIESVFEIFAKKKAIHSVGASKALHLINPELFMMWDRDIQKEYGFSQYKLERYGVVKCYIDFLVDSQKVASSIATTKAEIRKLWEQHFSELGKLRYNLFYTFSQKC